MVSKKRNAIMQSLLKLLDERPLNKITVKDIVDDCGINRNTFYYHFEDISSLIEAIIIDEVDRVMIQYRDVSSMELCGGPRRGREQDRPEHGRADGGTG